MLAFQVIDQLWLDGSMDIHRVKHIYNWCVAAVGSEIWNWPSQKADSCGSQRSCLSERDSIRDSKACEQAFTPSFHSSNSTHEGQATKLYFRDASADSVHPAVADISLEAREAPTPSQVDPRPSLFRNQRKLSE